MYIVQYSTGDYDDFIVHNIFVTEKKETATKYVSKFNRIFKKWKKYYWSLKIDGQGHFFDEHPHLFNRWCTVTEINKCFWSEIQSRKYKKNKISIMKNKDEWYQTGIGIIKKYNKNIIINSTNNKFTINSKKELNISDIDSNRLKILGWEIINKYKLIRKI